MELKVKILDNFAGLPLPKHQTNGAAGIDLCAAIENTIVLKPMKLVVIPTGLAFELPLGNEATIRPRSSSSKKGILVYLGTCDEDFVGEYSIVVQNLSEQDFEIKRGDRLAQMVVTQYTHLELKIVDKLKETARGDKGFGSTGK